MEKLLLKSNQKIQSISTEFSRFLLERGKFDHRLIAIKGARGTGKTTLMLQYAKKLQKRNKHVLYLAMDDLFFQENSLYNLAEQFALNKGEYLLLDEVHKYPNWSREIKLIYDDITSLNIVFTSSSILNIYNAESDLSRRVVSYTLPELSLREYINLTSGTDFQPISLSEILKDHVNIASGIAKKIKPVFEFNGYLKYGQYPYFLEGTDVYYQKIMATVNLILELDLQSIENIDYGNIAKLKKLLFAISTSVPYIPNISKLSSQIGLSRPFLIKALNLLERARLIIQLHKASKGNSYLAKPDKLYINNTNILHAIGQQVTEKGTQRETFFVNQLGFMHSVSLPDNGDFLVDNKITFEIGGKNKSQRQIKNISDSYVVKDNIETGTMNIIPLWLFGFLY